MSFKVKTKMDIDIGRIVNEFDDNMDDAYEKLAKQGAVRAFRIFSMQHQGLGKGEMIQAFAARKSKYGRKGGWIFGTFWRKGSGKWEDSLGGRAHFFEYGRSAPGDARSGIKVQPPRPFMRPTLGHLKKTMPATTKVALRRAGRKANKFVK